MRLTLALLRLLPLALAYAGPHLRPRDYDVREYYAVQLEPTAKPAAIAAEFGLEYEGPLGQLADHHLFSGEKGEADVLKEGLELRRRKRDVRAQETAKAVLYAEKQDKLKKLEKRSMPPPRQENGKAEVDEATLYQQSVMKTMGISDPIFEGQWHLYNKLEKGHDVNVTGLWLEGITGHNATVAIVDDGLDMDSLDLKDNYFAAGSYDFNDHVSAPKPRLSDDRHGTRCAGEIAAVKNDVCGVGVAWDSKVAGIRILSKQISDADEAIALNYAFQENQIYSCSWGPPDDGRSMDAPGVLIKKAILNGIQNGRNKLGSIFVFASGNGAANGDNCNFDGYTNSIYSITVGAIDRKGMHPYYSELCSAQLTVTYSSGSGDAIHTTDVGVNQCYDQHGGTSAAAPLAAGIYALVLSLRPDLSWRDLQYITIDTAVPVNTDEPGWDKTVIGKQFSHKYGYGKMDAWALVEAAKEFKSVKPQVWFKAPIIKVDHAIPEGPTGLMSTFEVTKDDLKNANFARVEHVTVKMNAEHTRRGDMSVDLISPNGIVSHIATARNRDESKEGYQDWTFMSVKHWGEDGVGKWSIIIKDSEENKHHGNLIDWQLELWGEAVDADKATLHPLPGEETAHPTSAGSVQTTTAPHNPVANPDVTGNPDGHIDRPVNSKPGAGADTTTGAMGAFPTGEGSKGTEEEVVDKPSSGSDSQSDDSTKSGFLPSFLPTFGVSPKTQAWIYGSAVAILAFVGLIAFYLMRQRRRQRAAKDGMEYEFEALGDEDMEEGAAGAPRPMAAAGGRRKARDLYDAFGESEEEEEEEGLFSDEEARERERDYEDEDEDAARGVDEGPRTGVRAKLLGRDRD